MKGDLWTIAVVLVFLAMMLPAVGLGFESAADERTIDEELTLEHQEPVEVSYADDVTDDEVTVTVDGTELEEGTDYDWDSGEITLTNDEFDGETADVTYSAETQSEETHDVAQILGAFDGWIAIVLLFVVVGAIVAMAFGGSNFGGR